MYPRTLDWMLVANSGSSKLSNHSPRLKQTVLKTLVWTGQKGSASPSFSMVSCGIRRKCCSSMATLLWKWGEQPGQDLVGQMSCGHRSLTSLAYIQGLMDSNGRLLSRGGIRTIFKPTKKIQLFLRPVKDARDSLSSYAQCIVYLAHVYICTYIGEHSHCCLCQPEKSAVAEHTLANADHCILFKETKILSSVRSDFTHLHRELIQIQQYTPIATNQQGESLSINRILHAVLLSLSE